MEIIDFHISGIGALLQVKTVSGTFDWILLLGSIQDFISGMNEMRRQEEQRVRMLESTGIEQYRYVRPDLIVILDSNDTAGRFSDLFLVQQSKKSGKQWWISEAGFKSNVAAVLFAMVALLCCFGFKKYFRTREGMWRADEAWYNNVKFWFQTMNFQCNITLLSCIL